MTKPRPNSPTTTKSSEVPQPVAQRLRKVNVGAGVLHALQGIAMLVLSSGLKVPVSATFATAQPGQVLDGSRLSILFSFRLGPAVAAFSLLSAFFHLLVASGWGFPRYIQELGALRNRFRWVEYSISSSLMIVLIAVIAGISDVSALIALFGVNASMILFGWLMETTSRPATATTKPNWSPFVFGCVAGVFPWIAIGIYLFGAGSGMPGFVYGIFVSIFVFFNTFAINQWLQYRAKGKWANYLHGERVYIVLSLVAKSLLAWQIFANVLV